MIFHDHGSRYLGKMFNDDWMRDQGFLEREGLSARDLVTAAHRRPLVTVDAADTISRAVGVMAEHGYSQIPVTGGGRIVGSLSEARLYAALAGDPLLKSRAVDAVMQAAFPFVDISTGIDAIMAMISPDRPAVLVRDFKSDETFIITRADIVRALA